jgi:UTP--glucose-1-phosphate uridylyltransferase
MSCYLWHNSKQCENRLYERLKNMIQVRKMVFPVGGLGTRFLPATKAIPKEMLMVVDKPLIHYAAEEAQAAGGQQFIFVTGRGKTAIEDHFDYSYELNATLQKRGKLEEWGEANQMVLEPGQVAYIRQQEPLGLGHAVWCARHLIGAESFAVILADDLIQGEPTCLVQMCAYVTDPHAIYVAVTDVAEDQVDQYGILQVLSDNGQVVHAKGVVEKPPIGQSPSTVAIVGRYILPPQIMEYLGRQAQDQRGEIQLTDAIAAMVSQGVPLYGIRYRGQRFDCGSKSGWLQANIAYALARPDLAPMITEAFYQAARKVA